jgi:hypothetical protein
MSMRSTTSRPVRLAEREALAVDLCACGTFAVHMGALSLRLDLESVSSLIDVLSDALAKHEAIAAGAQPGEAAPQRASLWAAVHPRQRRGKA